MGRIEPKLELLEKMVSSGEGDAGSIKPLQTNEMLMINSATATSVGTVSSTKGGSATYNYAYRYAQNPGVGSHYREELVPGGG